MEYQESLWNGYKRLDFQFEGHNAILVVPDQPTSDKRWMFKTEYFGAFPNFEIEMLGKGYYLTHVKNTTRWCLPEDTQRQVRFAKFLQEEFGLYQKCMTVGMSCGGMQAIYLAAAAPELVALAYVDAPVMNLLSCPGCVGASTIDAFEEFTKARGMTKADLINYRHHPIDCVPKLIENRIPVFLICGDSDQIVPYEENGAHLYRMYTQAGGTIQQILKPGCDHHPHGIQDTAPLMAFVEQYYPST